MNKRMSALLYSLLITFIANLALFNSGPGLYSFFGTKYHEVGIWFITGMVFYFSRLTIKQIQEGYMTLSLIKTLSALYVIAFLITVFFKNGGYGIRLINLNLKASIIELEQYPLVAILNVLLWIPFGAWLRLKSTSYKKALLYGFLFSLSIESIQYIFSLGVSDINDLIANTAGVLIGFWLVDKIKAKGIKIKHIDNERIGLYI